MRRVIRGVELGAGSLEQSAWSKELGEERSARCGGTSPLVAGERVVPGAGYNEGEIIQKKTIFTQK